MKYLVTGGAGFLGSQICKRLLNDGDSVVCLDNLLTGSNLNYDPNYTFVSGCLEQMPNIDMECDGVFHLASPTAPGDFNKYPAITSEVNVKGTQNLINFTASKGIPLLFASTIRVRDVESNVYVDSKRVGETILLNAGGKIARMGNAYGPGMRKDDSRVIPAFIRKALSKESITIFGDGSQLDTFCYVEDMVDALVRFMRSKHNGLIELGGSICSIRDLALIVLDVFNVSLPLLYENSDFGIKYPDRALPDPAEAVEKLGWRYSTSIYDGLRKMRPIDYGV